MIAALFVFAASAQEAEPVRLATVNLAHTNADARGAAEAVVGTRADLVALQECSRTSFAEATFAAGGYQLLLDLRDPGEWGLCIVGRGEASTRGVPAPWGGQCGGTVGVARFSAGNESVALLNVHLPPRLSACGDVTEVALAALQGMVADGRLKADFGSGRAGDRVVIAGDLGSPPKKLAGFTVVGLQNGAAVFGEPMVTTKSGPVSLWYDHILVPAAWKPDSAATFEVPGSDHSGVWLDVTPN